MMPRKGPIDVRSVSTFLYLASVGFAAAASVSLFVVASLSLYGPGIPMHAESPNSDSPGGGKFSGTVARLSDRNIAPARQTEPPTLLEVRGVPSDVPARPSPSVSHQEMRPGAALKPDSEKGSTAVSLTQHLPPLGRSDDVTPSRDVTKPTGDEVAAGIAALSKSRMPLPETSAEISNPPARESEARQTELPKSEEGSAASPDEKLGQQSRNHRSDDHVLGLRAAFRSRVKRECGPIHDRALYRDCVATFSIYRN
jgi:hypothetical protein